ncbi:MAG: YceI family protein [Ktedonobacteraceae bacterium]|nr:YceI family protein [Ktedonobacteraceae bacterium]
MVWVIDATHSQVTFAVRHVMVSTVKGQFKVLSGKLDIDEAQPENSWIEAQVDTASVDTRDPNRDAHLRSPDFFDVEKYPVLTFKSTKVERTGGNEYRVLGDLTMHGVTKPVVFTAEYFGQHRDPYGRQKAGLSATAKINRKDWGLTYNQALETGGVLVSEEVRIEIDLAAVRQD